MILGGEPDKSVITFDPTTSAYTSGPDMLNDHENFGCAHFDSDAHFGRPVVLAAGGRTSKAEILDYTGTGKWTSSKLLFNEIHFYFFALNFFLLILVDDIPSYIGGDGPRAIASFDGKGAYLQYNDKLFKLSCDSNSCSWSLMSQKLSVGRHGTVLMHLPDDYNCAGN